MLEVAVLRHVVLLCGLRLLVRIDEFEGDLVVFSFIQFEQIFRRCVVPARVESFDLQVLLYLLCDTRRLIGQAVDLFACRIDALDMLGAEIIDEGQNADEEQHRRCGIDTETRRPSAETRADLVRLDRERRDDKHSAKDQGNRLVSTPDRPYRIGNDGCCNDRKPEYVSLLQMLFHIILATAESRSNDRSGTGRRASKIYRK